MSRIIYCIGAQKAGTSWLFYALQQSGIAAFPAGKEAHYWDWVEQGKRPRDDALYWSQLASTVTPYAGDFTPGYAVLSAETVQAIYAAKPDIQVVFILRDPVERAWSAARMVAEYARLTDAEISDSWLRVIASSRDAQRRGDYAATLETWLQVIPAAQFHLLGFGDIQHHPERTFHWLSERLGFAPGAVTVPSQVIRTTFNAGRPHPLADELREQLQSLYAPHGAALEECLQRRGLRFDCQRWQALV